MSKLKKLEKLELKNVGFTYPGADKPSLNKINITFAAGKSYSIVGKNGSGKSTLSKIILGLYEPTEGEIYLNDKPSSATERLQLSAAVFQDIQKYPFSLRDILLLACTEEERAVISDEYLVAQLREFNLQGMLETLPEGLDTILSKEFGGVDLSGGQWQRLSILRANLLEAELISYDEPTSAIDPLFELELLQSIVADDRHTIKIVITHRLGIAPKTDKIIVLNDGCLIESGHHEELYALNGEYTRLWNLQKNWYTEEATGQV